MRNPKTLAIVVGVLVVLVVGFFFVRPPQPDISISADPLFTVGPLTVTNALLTAYIVLIGMVIASYLATRKANVVPRGYYNFVEAIVEWLLNFCEDIAGFKNGRRFFPVCASMFLFIVCCNYTGLVPLVNTIGIAHELPGPQHESKAAVTFHKTAGVYLLKPGDTALKETDTAPPKTDSQFSGVLRPFFRSPMSDVNAPLSIAIWSAIFVEWWGLSTLGFKYVGKFLAFPPFTKGFNPINVFVGFLEALSETVRIISFTFRLFGNIFAGDVVILFISFLAPLLIPTAFFGMEAFVGFIQAAVFALLTLVFAVSAVEHHDESEHEEAHGSPATQGELPAL